MNLPTFTAAVFTLLILPGPTNAVLAMASAALTPRRAFLLLSTVASSYLVVAVPTAAFAGPLLTAHPAVAQVIKLLSATWVLYLALRLWAGDTAHGGSIVGARQLCVTTLLNPKAIIVGLAFMPSLRGGLHVAIPAFAGVVAATSTIWLGFGSLILAGRPRMPLLACRCGSVLLLTFSLSLILNALTQ